MNQDWADEYAAEQAQDSWDIDEETRLEIMEDEYQAELDRQRTMREAWEQEKAA